MWMQRADVVAGLRRRDIVRVVVEKRVRRRGRRRVGGSIFAVFTGTGNRLERVDCEGIGRIAGVPYGIGRAF
jgi:hypothetical protein